MTGRPARGSYRRGSRLSFLCVTAGCAKMKGFSSHSFLQQELTCEREEEALVCRLRLLHAPTLPSSRDPREKFKFLIQLPSPLTETSSGQDTEPGCRFQKTTPSTANPDENSDGRNRR